MEPVGYAEEKEAKEHLATVDGGGDERGRFQLATVGEIVTRQRKMERLPEGRMPPSPLPPSLPRSERV